MENIIKNSFKLISKNKGNRPNRPKWQIYSESSLFGSIIFIMLHELSIGWLIGLVSLIYAIIAVKLSIKNNDKSSKIKAYAAIILIIAAAINYIN